MGKEKRAGSFFGCGKRNPGVRSEADADLDGYIGDIPPSTPGKDRSDSLPEAVRDNSGSTMNNMIRHRSITSVTDKAPQKKRGFFARLFKKKKKEKPVERQAAGIDAAEKLESPKIENPDLKAKEAYSPSPSSSRFSTTPSLFAQPNENNAGRLSGGLGLVNDESELRELMEAEERLNAEQSPGEGLSKNVSFANNIETEKEDEEKGETVEEKMDEDEKEDSDKVPVAIGKKIDVEEVKEDERLEKEEKEPEKEPVALKESEGRNAKLYDFLKSMDDEYEKDSKFSEGEEKEEEKKGNLKRTESFLRRKKKRVKKRVKKGKSKVEKEEEGKEEKESNNGVVAEKDYLKKEDLEEIVKKLLPKENDQDEKRINEIENKKQEENKKVFDSFKSEMISSLSSSLKEQQEETRKEIESLKQSTLVKMDAVKSDESEVLKSLKEDQERMKKLLSEEKDVKDSLLLELQELKSEIRKKGGNKSNGDEEKRIKRLLEDNEKKLEEMKKLIKKNERKKEDLESDREKQEILRMKKEQEMEAKEIERLNKLAEALEREKLLLDEEVEAKKAFEEYEKLRLEKIRNGEKDISMPMRSVPLPVAQESFSYPVVAPIKSSTSFSGKFSWDQIVSFAEIKVQSFHFYDAVKYLIGLCFFLLVSSIVAKSFALDKFLLGKSLEKGELGWIPIFGSVGPLAVFLGQILHSSYLSLYQNVTNLFKIGFLFAVTDEQPMLVYEISLGSFVSTALVGLLTQITPVGASGVVLGFASHIFFRSLLPESSWINRVSGLVLLAYLAYDFLSGGLGSTIVPLRDIPAIVGGVSTGVITAVLSRN